MQAPMTIKQYVSQMRKIPGGRFTMGWMHEPARNSLFEDELPSQQVDVSSFRMGSTLVTVGMWREYVRANKRLTMPAPPSWDWIDNHPMVNISWIDIVGSDGQGGYCAWATRVTGVRACLPTEAQWEYVAKSGSSNFKFPWGNYFDMQKVWSSVGGARSRTAPVVRKEKIFVNKFGVSDMSGNVRQWCIDAHAPYKQQKRDRLGYLLVPANPKIIASNLYQRHTRVLRGGGWNNDHEDFFRCSYRNGGSDEMSLNYIGFRLVADV